MRTRTFVLFSVVVAGAAIGSAQGVPPPPGRLVDAGGFKLHVNCAGAGSPTVILEAGASSFSIDWALVQPAVYALIAYVRTIAPGTAGASRPRTTAWH